MARTQTAVPTSLKVGEEVILRLAGGERRGFVVEDRGPLGVEGRQIVTIRVGDEEDARHFEVRAEDLERVVAT